MLPVRERKPLVKARALRQGDRVGVVAPSSRPSSPAIVAAAERIVRDMGFEPVFGEHVSATHGFMAGTDEQRFADLSKCFSDDSIAGIFCLTGGYGATHLLPMLDYDAIAANPKVFVGCDDNTVLLNALFERAGLVTFHGPNLDEINSQLTFERFRMTVTSSETLPPVERCFGNQDALRFDKEFYCAVPGEAEGHIIGGNLTALVTLLGTPFEPRFFGSIIALDDIHEQTGMLDRWLTTLYLAGHLQTCRGVAFGAFSDCGPRDSWNMLSVMESFSDRLKYLGTPSCFGLPFGQSHETCVIPIGVQAKLNAAAGKLEFAEAALGS